MPFRSRRRKLTVAEGKSATVTAQAGGAQKVYWILKREGRETIVAVDRFSFTFDAGRVAGDQSLVLQFKAVYADGVKTRDIPITIKEDDSRAGLHPESAGDLGWPRDHRGRAGDRQPGRKCRPKARGT